VSVATQPALVQPLRKWDPEQVDGYVILGRLGAGAMGQVYLGRSAAGRLVAIKMIKSELAEEPDFRTRFGQEVAAARRVSGAFTAAVVAADSEADMPWLATTYVPAPSLNGLVRACGPLPVPAVRWLAAGCAEALEAIHGVGLVHRDLKPSNVLVSPDGPRVIDFGLARAAERIQLTVTRGSVGTPAYMAPEQARDTRQATGASDVFSLGATILFAATGHPPYQGETVMDVLVRLATEPPDVTGLPGELSEIVMACLRRDPRSRPSMAAIVARLAAGGELEPAPLPAAAFALIDKYRVTPSLSAGGPVDAGPGTGVPQDWDLTLGSHLGRASVPRRATDSDHGTRAGSSSPGLALPGSRPRGWLITAAVVAGIAVLAGGWLVGHALSGNQPAATAGQHQSPPASTLNSGASPGGSGLGPGGGQLFSHAPALIVNVPRGDPYTQFVIHGQSWPRATQLSITLVVGDQTRTSSVTTQENGTFFYVINQDHEFFSGLLPFGTYTVRVTGPGTRPALVTFEVRQNPQS
jgi:serine/threonine protein kinase